MTRALLDLLLVLRGAALVGLIVLGRLLLVRAAAWQRRRTEERRAAAAVDRLHGRSVRVLTAEQALRQWERVS